MKTKPVDWPATIRNATDRDERLRIKVRLCRKCQWTILGCIAVVGFLIGWFCHRIGMF